MTLRFPILFLSVLGMIPLPLAVTVHHYRDSRARLQEAAMDLENTARDVQEVLNLRSRQQTISLQQRPTQDVIAQVNAVLAEVGIPSNRLRSLTPESDALVNQSSNASGPNLKRQSLRLTLENLSMDDLGGFLSRWGTAQALWTVSRIELTHVRDQIPANTHFDANLLISAVYIADA